MKNNFHFVRFVAKIATTIRLFFYRSHIIMPISFESELQRLQHPQAGLIPAPVWAHYFCNVFTDAQLKLITTPVSDIQSVLVNMLAAGEIRPTGSPWSLGLKTQEGTDQTAWFAIAFAHAGNISDEILMWCAERLAITNKWTLLSLAAAFGRLSFFQATTEQIQNISIDKLMQLLKKSDNFMINAAAGGHVAIIEYLLALYPDHIQEILLAERFFAHAAEYGHIALMKRFFGLAGSRGLELIETYGDSALRRATKNKDATVIRWLLHFPSTLYYAFHEMHRESNYGYFRSVLDTFAQEKLTELQIRQQTFTPTRENLYFTIEDDKENDLYYEIMTDYLRASSPSPSVTKTIEQLLAVHSIRNKVIQGYENAVYHNEPNDLFKYVVSHEHFDVLTILLRCQRAKEFNFDAYLMFGNHINQLKKLFQSIPNNITILDLSNRCLVLDNPEAEPSAVIILLADSLPFIETVYLSTENGDFQNAAFRVAFREIFSDQLKNTFFVKPHSFRIPVGISKMNDTIHEDFTHNPVAIANLARTLKFPTQVPSLQAQAAFFAHTKKITRTDLPHHIHEIIDNAERYGVL